MSDEDQPNFPKDYRYSRLRFSEREVSLLEREQDDYIVHLSGLIRWHYDDERAIDLGAFHCKLIDGDGALNDRVHMYDVFDTESSTFDLYQDLYDIDTGELKQKVCKLIFEFDFPENANVLILDRLVIYPEHRGHGLGLIALRGLMLEFRSFASVFVMKPFPLQFEGDDGPSYDPLEGLKREHWKLDQYKIQETKARTVLRRHYAKLGFVHVPKTFYMVRNSQIPLPSVEELTGDK